MSRRAASQQTVDNKQQPHHQTCVSVCRCCRNKKCSTVQHGRSDGRLRRWHAAADKDSLCVFCHHPTTENTEFKNCDRLSPLRESCGRWYRQAGGVSWMVLLSTTTMVVVHCNMRRQYYYEEDTLTQCWSAFGLLVSRTNDHNAGMAARSNKRQTTCVVLKRHLVPTSIEEWQRRTS